MVDLVFRSIGERTSELGLELAIAAIRPARVQVIEGLRPLAAVVEKQRTFTHDADLVVYVDADCLILDDLSPFLESNTRPYVDCYVTDRFRGRLHCGVHITRADVVRQMALVDLPRDEDRKYVLRAESRLRNLALRSLKKNKEFKNFNILHDYFQYYRDVFYKYALRELRSRTGKQKEKLEAAIQGWNGFDGDHDTRVASMAIRHARRWVPEGTSVQEISDYIDRLPETAVSELDAAGIEEKGPFDRSELDRWLEQHPLQRYGPGERARVFGIGLSRTGTRSLSVALQILGWDTIHYPADAKTFEELSEPNYNLSILEEYNSITDITVAPYFAQLDQTYPGSKFILTVREREGWLRSCANHWLGRPAFMETDDPSLQTYLKMKRLLRAAVYGCYGFDVDRFSFVYEQHLRNVRDYFANRPADYLELDVCDGEGWEKLSGFLGHPAPTTPFPHRGSSLSKRMNRLRKARLRGLDTSGVHSPSKAEGLACDQGEQVSATPVRPPEV